MPYDLCCLHLQSTNSFLRHGQTAISIFVHRKTYFPNALWLNAWVNRSFIKRYTTNTRTQHSLTHIFTQFGSGTQKTYSIFINVIILYNVDNSHVAHLIVLSERAATRIVALTRISNKCHRKLFSVHNSNRVNINMNMAAPAICYAESIISHFDSHFFFLSTGACLWVFREISYFMLTTTLPMAKSTKEKLKLKRWTTLYANIYAAKVIKYIIIRIVMRQCLLTIETTIISNVPRREYVRSLHEPYLYFIGMNPSRNQSRCIN